MQPSDSTTRSGDDRRRNLTVAVVLAVAILGGALLAATLIGDPPREDPAADQDGAADKPRMIPQPGTGKAPDEPGDRGGWGQLLVLGLMSAGVVTVAGLAWRSSVRARRAGGNAAPGPDPPASVPAPDHR